MKHKYVSPSGGVSYGLEFPFRYKEEGESFVVFSTLDGWIWKEFKQSDQKGGISVTGQPWTPDLWQRHYFTERAAAKECRRINGLSDYASPDILAEIDTQE